MRSRRLPRVVSARVIVVAVLLAGVSGWAMPAAPASTELAAGSPTYVRYQLPADGAVLRGFEPPATRFGPGHRGVDLDVEPGSPVGSAAAGRVRFAGPVAGTSWVTVEHADGVVTSYGPLVPQVRIGQEVGRGARLGTLAEGGHGDGDRGLHWGARRQHRYVDPMSLLGPSSGRPSLVGPGHWRAVRHGDLAAGLPEVDAFLDRSYPARQRAWLCGPASCCAARVAAAALAPMWT